MKKTRKKKSQYRLIDHPLIILSIVGNVVLLSALIGVIIYGHSAGFYFK